jgi:hypothetical protein
MTELIPAFWKIISNACTLGILTSVSKFWLLINSTLDDLRGMGYESERFECTSGSPYIVQSGNLTRKEKSCPYWSPD